MEMKDLNKNQIVLLVLLISFVTSIATGIMTVSLLQQAPLEVTRNINSIVEKTIQTVTPGPGINTTQKEITTLVVKEDDLIVSSIDKNSKSIVRIKEKNSTTGQFAFYGMGLVITKDGYISADRKELSGADSYIGVMSDGVELTLSPTGLDKQTNFILFKASNTYGPQANVYTFTPAALSSVDLMLGQSVISLGGDTANGVSVGRVISFDLKDGNATTSAKIITGINTDVSGKDLIDGSPIFNLSGDIVGIKLDSNPLKSFTPISLLKKEIPQLVDTGKTP